MKKIFKRFLQYNTPLIKELITEYGTRELHDKLYDTNEFKNMVNECNSNTKEEEGYCNGWTDSKDELFNSMLKEYFFRLKFCIL